MIHTTKTCGFTLIELLVVLAVLSVVASIGALTLSNAFNGVLMNVETTHIAAQVNSALNRMGRDIRSVRSVSAADLTIASDEITVVDTAGNTIRYFLSGTVVMRNAEPLAQDVSALSFDYFDEEGTEITDLTLLDTVRYVQMNLTETTAHISHPFSLTVGIRNV